MSLRKGDALEKEFSLIKIDKSDSLKHDGWDSSHDLKSPEDKYYIPRPNGNDSTPRNGTTSSNSKSWLRYFPRKEFAFMALLALQYGLQPIISRKCIGPNVVVTSQVIASDVAKVVLAVAVMGYDGSFGSVCSKWNLPGALVCSALPAAVYALQNSLVQVAYKHLDYLTFSMLNQMKLLFTAIIGFIFLGQRQSRQQIVALVLMLAAAILLSAGQSNNSSAKEAKSSSASDIAFYLGVLPVLVAAVLSGIGSTACQWAIQVKGRSPYLMTLEMSVIGSMLLLGSILSSPDGAKINNHGFFHGWTLYTTVPVLANAVGGILVGLVTKFSGGIKKGFVIIAGLIVTALAQFLVDGDPPSLAVWLAMPLVAISTIVHSKYPYVRSNIPKKMT